MSKNFLKIICIDLIELALLILIMYLSRIVKESFSELINSGRYVSIIDMHMNKLLYEPFIFYLTPIVAIVSSWFSKKHILFERRRKSLLVINAIVVWVIGILICILLFFYAFSWIDLYNLFILFLCSVIIKIVAVICFIE